MTKKAVYSDLGAFMGFMYVIEGERVYAPAKGYSDIDLASYCDLVY